MKAYINKNNLHGEIIVPELKSHTIIIELVDYFELKQNIKINTGL